MAEQISIIDFDKLKNIGIVESVDTGSVIVRVGKEEFLNSMQVNDIVAIRSSKTGEKIIGIIIKIVKKMLEDIDSEDIEEQIIQNVVRINLIGTFLDRYGEKRNVFKRTLETVPSINAECFLIDNRRR